MTNEKLYEVLGDINEKHVYEARAYHKAKKSIWAKWGVMAACLCLIVAGTVAMLHQPKYDTMTGDPIKDAGGGISGGSEMAGCYSIAVFPDTKSEDSVEIAEVITLSETEVKNNSLSVHLPQALPEGFHFGRGSLYTTVMKDGAQYNMLSVQYITGYIPESQVLEDGGEAVPDPALEGESFIIRVMNYKPDSQAEACLPNEVKQSELEKNRRAYIEAGSCYVYAFPEVAELTAVLKAIQTIE